MTSSQPINRLVWGLNICFYWPLTFSYTLIPIILTSFNFYILRILLILGGFNTVFYWPLTHFPTFYGSSAIYFTIYSNYFWVHFCFIYIKLCESWCLVGSVLLYVKCTTWTDKVVAIVRIFVAAVRRWIAVAVVVEIATTIVPVGAGPWTTGLECPVPYISC